SGTTAGQSKKFPVTREYESAFQRAQQYMQALVKRAASESPSSNMRVVEEGKIFSVSVAGRQYETKGGHMIGSALTNYYRGEGFKNNYDFMNYTSPIEVVLTEDSPQALYCHLLCGLLQASQVWCLEAGFAFNMDAAFAMLRTSWQSICKDIKSATLSEEIKDDNVRNAVLRVVHAHANSELAEFIEGECCKCSWEGIVRRLWPNAVYIQCRAGGPLMKPYLYRINYYSGNLPIYGLSYGASEGGHLAICTRPSSSLFTFLPTTAFYEFIPLSKAEHDQVDLQTCYNDIFVPAQDTVVEFHALQVGHYYQPVVTTFQGLYRYKLGDVIRMKGFNGRSPEFEYVQRNNVLLSVNTDKTDEGELHNVMEKVCLFVKQARLDVVDYTSCVEYESDCSPGHYVIFVEIDGPPNPYTNEQEMASIMQECCCLLDSSFNHAYKKGRKAGRIGALELRIVGRGGFYNIMQYRLQRGGISMSQYKPPRSIPCHSPLHQILNDDVIATYKSTLTSWNVYHHSN
ncbi:hypothetical protein KI387_026150, partial [Taxus chinensis]